MARLFSARLVRFVAALLVVLLLVAVGLGLALFWMRDRLTNEDVQQLVMTTIQQEAPASFFVTGELYVTATVTVENTKYLLPDLLDLNLGTTRARVRAPGRVSYGFDARSLAPEDILIGEDGGVEVALPSLSVYGVEADLEQLEVETSVGWARMHARSGQRVEQRALGLVQQALREQGRQHLATSAQPRLHTAEALERLLAPVLQAAGIDAPRFRFYLDERLVLEPEG